ncbi:MAG: transketolase [Ruminococcaceae bacterium]|nr:transketolase [Oscillospiraceae bacterium]
MAISWEVLSLQLTAAKCRQNVLRMIKASGHGHLGGAFSSMEIVTALYFHTMNVHPADPKLPDRDRFLLSAGHKSMVQYAVLAERGFFEKSILDTYGSLHCKLPGHPDMHKLPGVEANTGALGHGLSIACGMAMGLKQDKKKSRVFVVLGDGELPEGSNWEGASVASHFKLDNLVAFVDYNGLQISGKVEDIMNMSPIDERFKAFGWSVTTIDGNDMAQVVDALDSVPLEEGKPSVIIARTVKSKGLSFAENDPAYHFWSPSAADLEKAEAEVAAAIAELETQLKGRIKA